MRRSGLTGSCRRLLLVATVAAAVAAAASPAVAAPRPRPTQELVTLDAPHQARAAPTTRSARIASVPAFAPITGGPTVLPVIGHDTGANGTRWLRVLLPGRPNGRSGWITRRATTRGSTSWHIVVRTKQRRVAAYRKGRLVRSFSAIVGKPSTPTPHGRFFVEESVRMPSDSAGAPFALALSARSNVLQEFEGGPGQIALHGVANLGGTLGTAVSHGCVRLANPSITWLAARIPPGARVTITA